jgi:hypothetical protein
MSLNSIFNAARLAHVALAANDCKVMAIAGEEAVSV